MSKASLSLCLFIDSEKKKSELSLVTEIDNEKIFNLADNRFYGSINDLIVLLTQAFNPIDTDEFGEKSINQDQNNEHF